ncbi:MAG: hypothetical protein JWQ27_34 [Ferruginibacter sp.]|nr:hypothetical protein [Ferruginibacter sp.]
MGGTMIDFTTMAVFKTAAGETVAQMLSGTNETSGENSLMHYDQLYAVKDGGNTIYIAHGFGQGSTALPWQELRAFQVRDRQLVNSNIFPGSQPSLFVEFDLHHLNREEIPMILVIDSARRIFLPVQDNNEGFSGEYQELYFRNGVYKKR